MSKYKIGNQIKVAFEIRGKMNMTEFSGDFIQDLVYSTDEDISPDLLGIAETPWGEVLEILDNEIVVKLLNQPLFQLDGKTREKIGWGDICLFELKDDNFPTFKELVTKHE